MRVILLEFIDEAKAALKEYGPEGLKAKDLAVISMHPRARSFLKSQGVESEDTIKYFTNEAQHRIILECYRRVNVFIQELEMEDQFGIKGGYRETMIYQLRFYVNHLLWIIEMLKMISRKYNPTEIIAYQPDSFKEMFTDRPFIHDNERFLGFIAQDFCQKNNIIFKKLALIVKLSSKKRPSMFNRLAKSAVKFLAMRDYRKILKGQHQDVVLVPGLSYRMNFLFNDIKKKSPNVKAYMIWSGHVLALDTFKNQIFRILLTVKNEINRLKHKDHLEGIISLDLIKDCVEKDSVRQEKIKSVFNRFLESKDEKIIREMNYDDISIEHYLKEKVKRGLMVEILSLQHYTTVMAKLFEVLKPNLLISMYSSGVYYLMGELANHLKFNALNISHGTHVPPNNEYEKIENYQLAIGVISNTYPYVSVQTPWTERFLDYYKDSRIRLRTGPLIYSVTSLKDKEEFRNSVLPKGSNKKIVVHATTMKARYGARLHIAETLDEYLSSLTDIIYAVNKLDNVHFVIRPHPSNEFSDEDLYRLLPKCNSMSIANEGSFARILSACDLLISYSSTCIEEAIQNNIPVLLYDKWQRYNHFNVKELKDPKQLRVQPAYYVTQANILTETIDRVLKNGDKNIFQEVNVQDFKYPQEFRSNFDNFINETFGKKEVGV